MRKKYKTTLLLLAILLLISIGVSISYAHYEKTLQNNSNDTLVTSDEYLSINYLDGNYYDIKSFKENDTIVKKISITNVTPKELYVTIALMDINKETNDLNVRLVDKDNKEVYNESLGNIDTELIKTKELAAGQTISYTVYLTYNGKEDNYGLTANLIAYKELIKKDRKTLKELILANNNLSQLQTNIGEVATSSEGLIETQNDTASTYYFRGSVTNNYVKFANVMFRIVRINEDGSVRLITDNLLDDKAPYKKTVPNIEDAGNVLLSTSTIKETLNDFYNNTLSDYQKYVVDSSFCSENTYYIEEENKKLFTSYNRIINETTASLSCSGTLEQSKVGLLSIDEAIYAGASKNGTNTSYYLYNPNITSTWWTLTGSQVLLNNNAVDNFAIGITGEILSETKITSNQGIRPVISLDKTVSASGSGTYEDPYVIE